MCKLIIYDFTRVPRAVADFVVVSPSNFIFCRELDIKFEGHLLDPILNVATKVVTEIFKKFVLAYIEQHATQVIRAKIEELEKLLPRPNSMEPNMDVIDIDTFNIMINTLDLYVN